MLKTVIRQLDMLYVSMYNFTPKLVPIHKKKGINRSLQEVLLNKYYQTFSVRILLNIYTYLRTKVFCMYVSNILFPEIKNM